MDTACELGKLDKIQVIEIVKSKNNNNNKKKQQQESYMNLLN
jgi:hypothetical protein